MPLILTYHAIEATRSPLCCDPGLFTAHADIIAETRLRSVTIRELAKALAAGIAQDAVAITFDDGFANAVEHAAPLLEERGLTATIFCVAGHLGGTNDWPSARDRGPRARLASASMLEALATEGFEIGSHGMEHAPLTGASEATLLQELSTSRTVLEDAVGTSVTSFAYPYGALPGGAGRNAVRQSYDAACTTALRRVSADDDPLLLPRIDAHYVRDPDLLRRALEGGLRAYLRARSLGARGRRRIVKDYTRGNPRRSLSE
ncbi:MAG: polysaccharide deacetylase [Thermoleophilia bacterium]|nr:polysaccharide deacetylase [Thermoleophilia bacterium]